ncbi:MAG: putative formaldehyde dehydrogenase [Proteobacteria bacterium]|nr:putative formaldehyde dehydrogenase [Pseudomonadota bacterium]
MSQREEITEENRDQWSRTGIYLFLGTQLWHEHGQVHRDDGPAIVSPDGVERWYVRGREITAEVKTLFRENQWDLRRGLDTVEKRALFQASLLDPAVESRHTPTV